MIFCFVSGHCTYMILCTRFLYPVAPTWSLSWKEIWTMWRMEEKLSLFLNWLKQITAMRTNILIMKLILLYSIVVAIN